MFIFSRHHHTPSAEEFAVLIPAGGLPDATARFGDPLMHLGLSADAPRHHEVATLILFHAPRQPKGRDVHVRLFCRAGLTEAERETLYVEMQLLIGGLTNINGGYTNPDAGVLITDDFHTEG